MGRGKGDDYGVYGDGGNLFKKCAAVRLPLPEGIQPFDASEYIELRVLGTGTCGCVYQVKHVPTDKLYAWKVLNVSGKDSIQKRITQVMNLASTLKQHPNIVNCLGIWSGFGEVRLLYDHMDHGCIKGIRVSDETVLASIGKDILEGLRYLKDHNLTHGDLKPSNILFDFDSDGGMVIKLCDFAAGKNVEDDIWEKPLWLSLPSMKYMSPEAINYKLRKEGCETSGDIWSFGICMLEFYLGQYPIAFDREDFHSVCEGISMKHPPEPPSESSPEFQDFIGSCLRQEPNKRASIDQLLAHKFISDNTPGAAASKDGRTWAAATSTCSEIKLCCVPPKVVEDSVEVDLPPRPEDLEKWDSCLVGYFVEKSFGSNYMRNSAFSMWKTKGLMEVLANGDGFMFFIFENPECRMEVLEGGPWYIGGHHIILRPWTRMMHLTKERVTSVPVWVKLFNVPMEYWDSDGLSRIASAIGVPLFMDQPTAKTTKISFARVFVEIEAKSKKPANFFIRCEDESIAIRVEYQGLPACCDHCLVFGHDTKKCVSTQVAKLVSLHKETEQNPEWTTIFANGKRKIGEPAAVQVEENVVIESEEDVVETVPKSPSQEIQSNPDEGNDPDSGVGVGVGEGTEPASGAEGGPVLQKETESTKKEVEKLMSSSPSTPKSDKPKTKAKGSQFAKPKSGKSSGKGNNSQRKKRRTKFYALRSRSVG